MLGSINGTPCLRDRHFLGEAALAIGRLYSRAGPVKANEWNNLQAVIDLKRRTVSMKIGVLGSVTEVPTRPLLRQTSHPPLAIEVCGVFDLAAGPARAAGDRSRQLRDPGITHSALLKENPHVSEIGSNRDVAALQERLKTLSGVDGDFEQQIKDAPPSTPWNAGPNSVVTASSQSQSPFHNVYQAGELGMRMPNRQEYDGLGLTLSNPKPDDQGRLFLAFDFRCAANDAGGGGSWRVLSRAWCRQVPAAVELYFNGDQFFRRSGDTKDPVGALQIGEWYQVQLTLELKRKPTPVDGLAGRANRIHRQDRECVGWNHRLHLRG